MPASARDSICPRPPGKLRIRPDILRAIEEGDFARMPPRGYTSNMVGAYARLVGLNPTEVTRAYREEVYQFETGRRPAEQPSRAPPAMPGARSRCPPAAIGILSGLLPRRLYGLHALRSFRLGRFLGPHGQNGPAAPVHQPRPGPGRPRASRRTSARTCRSSSWAPSSWACSSS